MKKILFLLLTVIGCELKAHSALGSGSVKQASVAGSTHAATAAIQSAQVKAKVTEDNYITLAEATSAAKSAVAVKPAEADDGYMTVTHKSEEPIYITAEPSANKSKNNYMTILSGSKSGNATATSKGIQDNLYAPIVVKQPISSSYDAERNPIYGETGASVVPKVTASPPIYDLLVNPAETSSSVSGHVTTPAPVKEPVYSEPVYNAGLPSSKASATSTSGVRMGINHTYSPVNPLATRPLPALPTKVSLKQPAAATASSASGHASASSATSVVPPRISTNGTYSSATSASTKMAVKDYNTLLASTQSDMTSFVNALQAHEKATLTVSDAIRKGQFADIQSLQTTLDTITAQHDALVANLKQLEANGTDSAHLAVINNTLSVVTEQYKVYMDESQASLYAARLTAKNSFSSEEVDEMKTLVNTYLKPPLPAEPFLTNLQEIQAQEHVSMPANVQEAGQQAAIESTTVVVAATAVEKLQTVGQSFADINTITAKDGVLNNVTPNGTGITEAGAAKVVTVDTGSNLGTAGTQVAKNSVASSGSTKIHTPIPDVAPVPTVVLPSWLVGNMNAAEKEDYDAYVPVSVKEINVSLDHAKSITQAEITKAEADISECLAVFDKYGFNTSTKGIVLNTDPETITALSQGYQVLEHAQTANPHLTLNSAIPAELKKYENMLSKAQAL